MMESMTIRRAGRALVVSTATFVVLVLTAGSVFADTELGDTGKVGDHYLNDQSGYAGATCDYTPDGQVMTVISVRAPNIWARDKTTSRDRQRVGWRFIVRRRKDTSTKWTTLYTSSIAKARAYDNQTAFFETRGVQPSLPVEQPGHSSRYQVRVQMFWYRSDGSVAGSSLHRVDTYLETSGSSSTEFAYCPTTFQV
jgi:hypothetical protein